MDRTEEVTELSSGFCSEKLGCPARYSAKIDEAEKFIWGPIPGSLPNKPEEFRSEWEGTGRFGKVRTDQFLFLERLDHI